MTPSSSTAVSASHDHPHVAEALPGTMKAVVLKQSYKVAVEQVPTPRLLHETDVIVRVHLAGLCGSDLHLYRGTEDAGKDFTMGHEVVGSVVQKGMRVHKLALGDVIAVPFTVSCGQCFYCSIGHTSRCNQSQLFGTPSLQGCQAQYVRVPLADACALKIPEEKGKELEEECMLLMADILPTGYSAAYNARSVLDAGLNVEKTKVKSGVAVVIGCGPVGLCAITSALTLFSNVFATDIHTPRLEQAEKHGATALPYNDLLSAIEQATDGRGADAVLEVVGNEGALPSALELVRPYGVISSVGVHAKEVKLSGAALYDKNVRMVFGRCSVNTFYEPALKVLLDNQDLFRGFIQHTVGFDQAEEYYALFEKNQVGKTAFKP